MPTIDLFASRTQFDFDATQTNNGLEGPADSDQTAGHDRRAGQHPDLHRRRDALARQGAGLPAPRRARASRGRGAQGRARHARRVPRRDRRACARGRAASSRSSRTRPRSRRPRPVSRSARARRSTCWTHGGACSRRSVTSRAVATTIWSTSSGSSRRPACSSRAISSRSTHCSRRLHRYRSRRRRLALAPRPAAKTGRQQRCDRGDDALDGPTTRGNDLERALAHGSRRADRIAQQFAHGTRQLARVAYDRERVAPRAAGSPPRACSAGAGRQAPASPSEAGSSRL